MQAGKGFLDTVEGLLKRIGLATPALGVQEPGCPGIKFNGKYRTAGGHQSVSVSFSEMAQDTTPAPAWPATSAVTPASHFICKCLFLVDLHNWSSRE